MIRTPLAAIALAIMMSGARTDIRRADQTLDGASDTQSNLQQRAIHLMETRGDCAAAIPLFERAAKGSDRTMAARALLHAGTCYERLGRDEAREAYRRLLRDFGDQAAAAEARSRLARLPPPATGKVRGTLAISKLSLPNASDGTGAVSADGRYLLQFRETDGAISRITLGTGGSEAIALRSPSGLDASGFSLNVALSRDGQQLAYTWEVQDRVELRVGTLPGGPARVLLADNSVELPRPMSWSADSTQILGLFSARGYRNHLVLIEVATGTVRWLKDLGFRQPFHASLSPDGRWIVYDLPLEDGARDIRVLDSRSGTEATLVEHPANDVFPLWTADGRHIFFASDRTGSLSAWLLRVSEGKAVDAPVLVKRDLGRIWPVAMTEQGRLYFAVQEGMSDVYVGELDPATGRMVEAARPINSRFVGANLMPDWSPDGRYLAYVAQTGAMRVGSGSRALVIRSTDDGTDRRLFPNLIFFIGPRWSPGGRSIVVKGRNTDGRWGLHVIDLDTGLLTAVVLAPRVGEEQDIGPYQFSADGNSLVYVHRSRGIVRRDLKTMQDSVALALGSDEQVTPGRGFGFSPDTGWLAFAVQSGRGPTGVYALRVVESAGAVRELLQVHAPEYLQFVRWSADGKYLVFARIRPGPDAGEDIPEFSRIAVSGGAPEAIGLSGSGLRALSLHPDGRHVAYVSNEERWETWVMEDFLPPAARAPNGRVVRRSPH